MAILYTYTASTRAFYSLMRAGIKYPELDSNIVVNIFRSTVQSVSQFGCHSIFVSKRNMLQLNKLQGKCVKKCCNLGNWCHTQPLLKAMKVLPLSHRIHLGTLDLVKSCIISSSLTKKFIVKCLYYQILIISQKHCWVERLPLQAIVILI